MELVPSEQPQKHDKRILEEKKQEEPIQNKRPKSSEEEAKNSTNTTSLNIEDVSMNDTELDPEATASDTERRISDLHLKDNAKE
jgi:hypothetical protein